MTSNLAPIGPGAASGSDPVKQSYGTCNGAGVHALSATVCTADPVNSLSGAFTTSAPDLTLPGIGLPFVFSRSYTSADTTVGRLGPGWTDSYSASLAVQPNGDVILHGEDGQQVYYTKQADGSFVGAPGAQSVLSSVSGGYQLVRHDQVTYRFDSNGVLQSMRDRNGQGLTFAYDGSGHLATITDATGRVITVTSNADGTISKVSLPDGTSVSYGYTGGRLTTVTDPLGKATTFTYDSNGRLATGVDANNHTVVSNVYDASGRVSQQTDANGKTTNFAWDATTQTATITDPRSDVWKDVYQNDVLLKRIDPAGNTTQFGHDNLLDTTSVAAPTGDTTSMSYDARGNLLTATAPASLGSVKKTFAYDAGNNVTSVTDARGKLTTYGYDANGNNTSVVLDGKTVAQYTYNVSGQVTSSTDGNGKATTYAYDSNGNLTSVTDSLLNKTSYTYDADGRVLTQTDARGNKTTYTYDADGRLLTQTDPLGNKTTNTYDAVGNRTSVADANNHTTTYSFDADNHLTSVTDALNHTTSYTYDAAGNQLTVTDPLNHTTTYAYDSDNNRLVSMTTPAGEKTTYSYDANSNLASVIDPLGNTTSYTYDAAGRQLTQTDPLGNKTTYTYDPVGNLASVTDANNHTTSYAYDAAGRILTATAPDGGLTSYTYDGNGNPLARTDANNHTTTYTYDGDNNLTSRTTPLTHTWTYTYDANGNVASMVDPNGGTTTYTYDVDNRLTLLAYSDSTPGVTLKYDAVGNRTSMTDGSGPVTYTYDALNRLTSVTRGTDTFSYAYDAGSNLTSRTYPDTTVTSYTYDNDNRMSSVASGSLTIYLAYDAAGDLTAAGSANPPNDPETPGYKESRTYDRAGRLTEVQATGSVRQPCGPLQCIVVQNRSQFDVTLDNVGNPTRVDRSGDITSTTTYSYDANDRLTAVCYQLSCPGASDPFIRWTYDKVGNRLTETRPSGTTNYTYNALDELTQAGSTAYTYDQDGNEKTAGSTTLTYDLANRLKTLTSGSTTTTYTYDGDGNRLQASTGTSAAKKTNYLWDTNNNVPQLALERDGNNSVLRTYLYGLRRVAMVTGGNTYLYNTDQLGSVSQLTNSDGTSPQWTYAYDPFGSTTTETKNNAHAPTNLMKFAGEYLDATGLYHLRARQYDPSTGRFLRTDPLNADGGYASAYVYASDRPTVLGDPSGLGPIPSASAGVTAAASVTSPSSRELASYTPDCFVINPGGRCYRPRPTSRPALVYPFPKGVPKRDVGGGIHPTGNLPGYPALDFGAPAGTLVLAVASGITSWISGGSSPSIRPTCHSAYGWNFYLKADRTSITYFYTHLATRRVHQNEHVTVGQVVGTLANWHQWTECGIPDHLHLGATGPDSNIKAVFAAPEVRP